MPVYKHNLVTFPDPANRFLFVHIPRTAGRFLVENLHELEIHPQL